MTNDALPDYVRALLKPAAYPHTPASVELVQTHISYVFLAGDLVYKTKKPIDFGFIQQLDAETRRRFCEAEVRLNRRLAPDVYLDTVPITRLAGGGYAVEREGDPESEVVEHAVKMRRLPDDRTLDRLRVADDPPEGEIEGIIERLVDRLVAFHGAAEVVADDPDFAGATAVRSWWQREYGEAEGFIGETWLAEDAAALRSYVDATLGRQGALFDERLAQGRVVEGHGDLQAKHVYALEPPGPSDDGLVIVDCIEFNDWFHFRYLDIGYDIAFLAMDLEALGRAELGDEFAGRYIAAAGDETIGVLQPLHRAFRAFVRGKVESIGAQAEELPADQRARLAASAARYFRLAAAYAERTVAPSLTILVGASGTGKTLSVRHLLGRFSDWRTYLYLKSSHGSTSAFEEMVDAIAGEERPVLVIIEDIDRILESQGLTAEYFLNVLDGLLAPTAPVLWIATSNDPTGIEENLLDRPGRFDRVFVFNRPEAPERCRLIERYSPWPVAEGLLSRLAAVEAGLCGSHVREICHSAALYAVDEPCTYPDHLEREFEQMVGQHEASRRYGALIARPNGVGFGAGGGA